jgi:hypothetical protein
MAKAAISVGSPSFQNRSASAADSHQLGSDMVQFIFVADDAFPITALPGAGLSVHDLAQEALPVRSGRS